MATNPLVTEAEEWTATFLVVAPEAKTVKVHFGATEPEHREIEAKAAELGEVARVWVGREATLHPGWSMKNPSYVGLVEGDR